MAPFKTPTLPTHKRHDSLACVECGAVQWRRAPLLYRIYKFVAQRKSVTTSQIAEQFELSMPNASTKLKRLVTLDLVRIEASQNAPTGGILNTYAANRAA